MGIHKLFQLIESKAPDSVRKINIQIYSSKKVAIDTSNVNIKRQFINFWFLPLAFSIRETQMPMSSSSQTKTEILLGKSFF